jgi:hypothetical protein
MTNRTPVGFALLVLAMGVARCDSNHGPGPSPLAGAVPGGTQLAGSVSDAAWRPLAGARVEVVDGPHAGLSTTTDARGEYRLTGAFDDTTHFRATKENHVAATWPLPAICARCNPQWWIHFYLESLTSPAGIAGDYTLTFVADSACAGLPDEVRTRTYEATVTLTSRPGEPANSRFDATVTGGTFVERYNSFTIGVAGDYVRAELGDGHGGPGLVEQIAPRTYVTLGGTIAASVTDTSTIAGSFVGAFERCELASEWGSRFSCDGGVVSHGRCSSQSHAFSLRRR